MVSVGAHIADSDCRTRSNLLLDAQVILQASRRLHAGINPVSGGQGKHPTTETAWKWGIGDVQCVIKGAVVRINLHENIFELIIKYAESDSHGRLSVA